MDPCRAIVGISAISAALAQGKTIEQIDELAVFFSQLGDNLASISLLKSKQAPSVVSPLPKPFSELTQNL